MIMRQTTMAMFGLIAVASVLAAAPASAQTVEVSATWTAPTEGSPVDYYVVQLSVDGGPFTTVGAASGPSHTLELEVGSTYVARVAGVDDSGRQGVWSAQSEPYSPDLGPPGQPGKPMVM